MGNEICKTTHVCRVPETTVHFKQSLIAVSITMAGSGVVELLTQQQQHPHTHVSRCAVNFV